MDLNLRNKVAVVSGASKGIGLSIATALADAGARVVAGSRNPGSALSHLATDFPVVPFAVDLSTVDGPAQLIEHAVTQFGFVDILINNVGGAQFHPKGFLSISDDDWERTLALNVMSTVRASRAVMPIMIEHGGGAIVNISSLNAHQPGAPIADYSSAKAAVTNLSKALAEEFGSKGIRVNTVSPGPVRTPLLTGVGGIANTIAQASGSDRETIVERFPQMNSMTLGRLIEVDEVAALVLFLASDRAATITGSDFIIDGGMKKTI